MKFCFYQDEFETFRLNNINFCVNNWDIKQPLKGKEVEMNLFTIRSKPTIWFIVNRFRLILPFFNIIFYYTPILT